MKLHVGNGSVYLRPTFREDPENGWVNVDLPGPHTCLSSENPKMVEILSTDESNYYARHIDKTIDRLRTDVARVTGVCDVYGSIFQLPFPESSVREVLARQMFEHLSIGEAKRALIECDRVLRPGGLLRIDVPDTEETARLLSENKDPFYIRHLFGSRKDDYGYHLMGYTRESLKRMGEDYGFVFDSEETNIHFYPAFMLRFRKLYVDRAPWQYNFEYSGIKIPENWFCVEVGPGRYPWPRANEYVDIHEKTSSELGKSLRIADVQRGLPYGDKQVDFLLISHVFEHLEDPESAAREISRVAKQGLVECPHPWGEAVFAFEEPTHRWLVWPPKKGEKALRFWRLGDSRVEALRDRDVHAALCRLYRNGPARLDHDAILLRKWFYRNQPNLATIHAWEGKLEVVVE